MSEYRFVEGSIVGEKYKPGITFLYTAAVPDVNVDEYAILVEHDALNARNYEMSLRLADEGFMPYTVNLGIYPGAIYFEDGTKRPMRMNSYDLFDSEYGDFVVYEFIPKVEKEIGVKFAKSADMHMVSGGSSGGISAFVLAWFHSDFFHRVYMSSPSFLAMGRGNELPCLVKKCETKPLRIYEEYSENEPNEYFGSSYPVDIEMRDALIFAKYDFCWKYFPGEGHVSRYWNQEQTYERLKWMWADYKTKPITARDNSDRINQIVPSGAKWEKCNEIPKDEYKPKNKNGEYGIIIESADGYMNYAANTDEKYVYSFPKGREVKPQNALMHAMLHTIPRDESGVVDMALDKADRLYVLTSIGVQCVRSFGLIDGILDLPDNSKPLEISVSDALYIRTEKGCYRRRLVNCENECSRRHTEYYD